MADAYNYYARLFPALAGSGAPASQMAHLADIARRRALEQKAQMTPEQRAVQPSNLMESGLGQREVGLINLAQQGIPVEVATDIAFGLPIGTTDLSQGRPGPNAAENLPPVMPPGGGNGGGGTPTGPRFPTPAVMPPRTVSSPRMLGDMQALLAARFRR